MGSISEELYIIEKTLKGNPSVEKLLEIMQPAYMVTTGSIKPYVGNPELHDTQVHIGEVNSVILGIWPEEGPVWEQRFGLNSEINNALEEGLVVKERDYTHDNNGNAMTTYRLTENQKQLEEHGLEHLHRGHAIRIYLQPR